MSYSENVTKNDLKEVFTQLGLGVSFGQTYEAAWTATSTNSTPQRCTDSIYLPKGKYIGVIKLPVTNQESTLFFGINGISTTIGGATSKSQSSIPIIFEVDTDNRETYVVTGMSTATTYTYIERGFLKAICISDLKQYGTTVLDYYPVGSYYETSDASFDPNVVWGGTWVKYATDLIERKKILWTNSANTAFAAQTISLNLSDYAFVEVEFYSNADTDGQVPSVLKIPIDKGSDIMYFHGMGDDAANEHTGIRRVSVSASGVQFTDYRYKNRRSGGTRTTANQFCKPYRIYGLQQLLDYKWHRTA